MPHIFTDEEIAHIIEIADSYPSGGNNTVPHIRAMLPMIIRISLCCGLRLSEVINLKKRNFNASDGALVLEIAKDNKQRIVPMHESLSILLQKYCIVMGVIGQPDAWLFPGKDDSAHISLKTVDNRFRLILREVNISRPDKNMKEGHVSIVSGILSSRDHLYSLRRWESALIIRSRIFPFILVTATFARLSGI